MGKDSPGSRKHSTDFNISAQTYVDEDEPWTGILAAAEFAIIPKKNR